MKKLTSFIIFMVFALSVAGFPEESRSEYMGHGPEVAKIKGRMKYLENQIIVKFKGDVEPFRVIEVPREKVFEKIGEYLKKSDVVYAEPNYLAYALMVPNDPYYSYQWHLDNPAYGGIQMEEAWDLSTGAGVTVAVVDTGIRKGTDLANTCFVAGWDYVNNDSDPTDDNGHGTHVAGTIAQSTNNGVGVAGVAYESCLMPVKVLGATGVGTYANVVSGVRYAADHGAKVINLSLGGSSSSLILEEALAYAYGKGVTIVAAAGNDSSSTLSYPAAYDAYVIAVGATRYDETLSYYSNYGPSLDLVAPGGDTSVDQNGDGYGDGVLQQTFRKTFLGYSWAYYFFQGTSMATPHVSGVAALLISQGNTTTPDEVRAALQQTAEDKGAPGRDDTYGYGLVDAYTALLWTAGPDTTPPVVSNGQPTGTINDSTPTLSVVTNEAATCRGTFGSDKDYNAMELIFTPDAAGTYHTYDVTTDLSEGVYTLFVKAKDVAGNISSSYSWSFTVDITPPARVTGVTVIPVSSSQLNILWTANSEADLNHYNVYRSTTSGYVKIASPVSNSYSDTGLTPATTYYYVVSAVDVAGNEGEKSAEASGATLSGPVTVFSDSFEGGLGKWTQDAQLDWFTSTQRATDGIYSAEVDGLATNASITTKATIDLSGKSSATLTFDWLIESGLDLGEYLACDLSSNGGISWTEIRRLKGNVDPENVWHHVEITLDPSYLTSTFRIRFRAKMSLSTEDANVDNVVVTAQ